MTRRLLCAAAALVLVLSAACGDDDDGTDETATARPATAAATEEPSGTPLASAAIRAIDIQSAPAVMRLLDDTGGRFQQENVLYADITDDNVEEAVVPIASGGTLGYVAIAVFTAEGDDDAELLATLEPSGNVGGLSVTVEGGKLITLEPAPGLDDPECCPSQLIRNTYTYDGTTLRATSETLDSPSGGTKLTPGPQP